jgi:hypothetical protein
LHDSRPSRDAAVDLVALFAPQIHALQVIYLCVVGSFIRANDESVDANTHFGGIFRLVERLAPRSRGRGGVVDVDRALICLGFSFCFSFFGVSSAAFSARLSLGRELLDRWCIL